MESQSETLTAIFVSIFKILLVKSFYAKYSIHVQTNSRIETK